jgi:hypothetical protein
MGLTRIRLKFCAFKDASFGPNLEFAVGEEQNRGHDGDFTVSAEATQTEIA